MLSSNDDPHMPRWLSFLVIGVFAALLAPIVFGPVLGFPVLFWTGVLVAIHYTTAKEDRGS